MLGYKLNYWYLEIPLYTQISINFCSSNMSVSHFIFYGDLYVCIYTENVFNY